MEKCARRTVLLKGSAISRIPAAISAMGQSAAAQILGVFPQVSFSITGRFLMDCSSRPKTRKCRSKSYNRSSGSLPASSTRRHLDAGQQQHASRLLLGSGYRIQEMVHPLVEHAGLDRDQVNSLRQYPVP